MPVGNGVDTPPTSPESVYPLNLYTKRLMSQTFSLKGSKIPHRHKEVWETVREAQYAAYQALVNSSTPHFAQLDAAARDLISGFANPTIALNATTGPDYSVFTTRLGHGIGLDGHESPYVNQGPQGEREIKAGHVFSVEPGIYITSDMEVRGLRGVGVRLEDCFVVTEKDGRLDGEWLTGPVTKWGDI
jgi:Xaa-Pro aminopeptidase